MDIRDFERANSAEPGNPFARPSQQQPFQTDVADSTYMNGHPPSEGMDDDAMHQSEDRVVNPQAPLFGLQDSYGTRQRGDASRGPDRQGSGYNR